MSRVCLGYVLCFTAVLLAGKHAERTDNKTRQGREYHLFRLLCTGWGVDGVFVRPSIRRSEVLLTAPTLNGHQCVCRTSRGVSYSFDTRVRHLRRRTVAVPSADKTAVSLAGFSACGRHKTMVVPHNYCSKHRPCHTGCWHCSARSSCEHFLDWVQSLLAASYRVCSLSDQSDPVDEMSFGYVN